MSATLTEPRFQVCRYGPHAFEIQDMHASYQHRVYRLPLTEVQHKAAQLSAGHFALSDYLYAARQLRNAYRTTHERASETEAIRQAGYDRGYARYYNENFNRAWNAYVSASQHELITEERYTTLFGDDVMRRLRSIANA